MKKLFTSALLLLCASHTFAQSPTTTTTTYSPAQTLTIGGCTFTGVGGLTFTDGTITATSGALAAGSNGCQNNNPNVYSVTVTPTTQNYVVGSGAAAPSLNLTMPSAASAGGASCTVTNATTAASTTSTGGAVTLATPTAVGTTTYNITCSPGSLPAGASVTAAPASVTVVAAAASSGGGGTCVSTQLATVGNKSLTRQCSVSVSYAGWRAAQTVATSSLDTVLMGTYPNYISGFPVIQTINSGSYVALQFTPVTSGGVQFTANPSYGDGGIISLSTQPGALSASAAGAICVFSRGGSNSLYISSTNSSNCQFTAGVTYYVNFADVDVLGDSLCYNGASGTCATSKVSYTVLAGSN